MKMFGIVGASALLLVLGTAGPSYAKQGDKGQKDEKGQEQKAPPKQEEKQPATPPKQEQKPPAAPQKQQAEHAQPQTAPKAQQAAPAKTQAQHAQPQKQQPATAANVTAKQPTTAARVATKQPTAAAHTQTSQVAHTQTQAQVRETRTAQHTQIATVSVQSGRYAGSGGRIPADRFAANFGSSHYFQISTPFIVGGYSRFNYGGFAFGLYDPWPYGWYYTDDVYVDYLDGNYYLYDRVHPGARIQINVVI
jgi:hypothetical protein